MEKMTLKQIDRQYKNNGQHAEQVARFTLTGKIEKADNKPFTMCADCLDIQIKSARATVCKGTDIKAHIAIDKAERYGYVTADFKTMFIMNKTEWFDFCSLFGTITRESKQNGGQIKTRLKTENKTMIEWLTLKA